MATMTDVRPFDPVCVHRLNFVLHRRIIVLHEWRCAMIRKETRPALESAKQMITEAIDRQTAQYVANAEPTREMVQGGMATKVGRGRSASGKVVVSIRLDPDVIAKFKATGAGWQSRINDVLKAVKA
ncbi:BrnA antitoxin family protein [Mesorhizobium sp.]|uniref:BrnA antitoxin family protein n=1 Tax=Mesorhizobium sp. TaxID=1871066 RepID=UPI0025BB8B8E|nr:BrnA antitoxin family protein [Mesorhizobium sp.]